MNIINQDSDKSLSSHLQCGVGVEEELPQMRIHDAFIDGTAGLQVL